MRIADLDSAAADGWTKCSGPGGLSTGGSGDSGEGVELGALALLTFFSVWRYGPAIADCGLLAVGASSADFVAISDCGLRIVRRQGKRKKPLKRLDRMERHHYRTEVRC